MERGARTQEATVSDLGGGVLRVTQPLPWALDHVHCYALSSRTAGRSSTAVSARPAPSSAGEPRWASSAAAVRRIVVTHYHPDHLGLGGRAGRADGRGRDRAGRARRANWRKPPGETAPMSPRSRPTCARTACPRSSPPHRPPKRCGMPVRTVRADAPRREGDRSRSAGETFEVLLLPGHADGHIVLHGARDRTPARRRRPARGDHAERRALGGHGLRSARPLPRDAVAHRGTGAGRRLPGPRPADRGRPPAGRGRSGCTTRSGWT